MAARSALAARTFPFLRFVRKLTASLLALSVSFTKSNPQLMQTLLVQSWIFLHLGHFALIAMPQLGQTMASSPPFRRLRQNGHLTRLLSFLEKLAPMLFL